MWERFSKESGIICDHTAWAFGGAPDKLARLVLDGVKTATASAYPLYEQEKEALPKVGDFSVILNGKGEAVCIIQTTKVYLAPFDEVTRNHAYLEGEGDRSLAYWRSVHKEFFTDCLREAGLSFDETMKVVCEEFAVVFAP